MSPAVRWSPRPWLVLLLVVAVVGGGLTALTFLRPAVVASEEPPRGVVPVSSATLVCPDPSPLAEGAGTDVTFSAPRLPDVGTDPDDADGADDTDPDGTADTADVGPVDPRLGALASVEGRGPVGTWRDDLADDGEPVVVRALGSNAPGLVATQLGVAAEGDARGIAAVRCTEAGTSAWFVGLGTEVGHRPRLVLVNPESTPAELDLRLYGPGGPVSAAGVGSVVVPGRGVATYELDALAPDLTQLAVEVVVRSGRVASAVRDVRVEGLTPRGVDWAPVAAPPAERVVVPGVSGGSGERLLQLLAPGELDTQVDVRLLTARGPIVPLSLEGLELTAGVVREISLSEVTSGEVVAVELVADEPLVAGVRVVNGETDGPQELAYTAGALPLAGAATATDVRTDDGFVAHLLLTADPVDDDAGTALVTYVDPATGDVLVTERVTVPSGTTLAVPLDASGVPDEFAVTVTPSGGTLHAVLELVQRVGEERFVTLLPLRSARLDVEVPRVRHDLSAGLRPPS